MAHLLDARGAAVEVSVRVAIELPEEVVEPLFSGLRDGGSALGLGVGADGEAVPEAIALTEQPELDGLVHATQALGDAQVVLSRVKRRPHWRNPPPRDRVCETPRGSLRRITHDVEERTQHPRGLRLFEVRHVDSAQHEEQLGVIAQRRRDGHRAASLPAEPHGVTRAEREVRGVCVEVLLAVLLERVLLDEVEDEADLGARTSVVGRERAGLSRDGAEEVAIAVDGGVGAGARFEGAEVEVARLGAERVRPARLVAAVQREQLSKEADAVVEAREPVESGDPGFLRERAVGGAAESLVLPEHSREPIVGDAGAEQVRDRARREARLGQRGVIALREPRRERVCIDGRAMRIVDGRRRLAEHGAKERACAFVGERDLRPRRDDETEHRRESRANVARTPLPRDLRSDAAHPVGDVLVEVRGRSVVVRWRKERGHRDARERRVTEQMEKAIRVSEGDHAREAASEPRDELAMVALVCEAAHDAHPQHAEGNRRADVQVRLRARRLERACEVRGDELDMLRGRRDVARRSERGDEEIGREREGDPPPALDELAVVAVGFVTEPDASSAEFEVVARDAREVPRERNGVSTLGEPREVAEVVELRERGAQRVAAEVRLERAGEGRRDDADVVAIERERRGFERGLVPEGECDGLGDEVMVRRRRDHGAVAVVSFLARKESHGCARS